MRERGNEKQRDRIHEPRQEKRTCGEWSKPHRRWMGKRMRNEIKSNEAKKATRGQNGRKKKKQGKMKRKREDEDEEEEEEGRKEAPAFPDGLLGPVFDAVHYGSGHILVRILLIHIRSTGCGTHTHNK